MNFFFFGFIIWTCISSGKQGFKIKHVSGGCPFKKNQGNTEV